MDVTDKTTLAADEIQEPMDFFTSAGRHYIADGPLSKLYGDALNVLYKKEVGPDGLTLETFNQQRTALETMELDNSKQRQRWRAALDCAGLNSHAKLADAGMLYGVRRQDVRYAHMVEIIDAISRMSNQQKAASAVVLDAGTGYASSVSEVRPISLTGPHNTEAASPVIRAIEHYCTQHGVPVYESLAHWMRRQG